MAGAADGWQITFVGRASDRHQPTGAIERRTPAGVFNPVVGLCRQLDAVATGGGRVVKGLAVL